MSSAWGTKRIGSMDRMSARSPRETASNRFSASAIRFHCSASRASNRSVPPGQGILLWRLARVNERPGAKFEVCQEQGRLRGRDSHLPHGRLHVGKPGVTRPGVDGERHMSAAEPGTAKVVDGRSAQPGCHEVGQAMDRAGERLAVERADHRIAVHARVERGHQTLHLFGANAFVKRRRFRTGGGLDAANSIWHAQSLISLAST